MTGSLKVALAGLGTVGGGVARVLAEEKSRIAERCGRAIEITAISSRTRTKAEGLPLSGAQWFDDPRVMARDAKADVVVEVIGGETTAAGVIEAAIDAGRHVVTANKSLLAVRGAELARKAEARGVSLKFEAAVAGGIPIIKALKEGLVGNAVTRAYGILNGTCNYILTQMEQTGRPFAQVLADAQKLGYAEADPTLDVGGGDTAHKLAVLAGVAFGVAPDLGGVHVQGIEQISPIDIGFAREFGYRIKLLGVAVLTPNGVEQRVHPAMVKLDTPLADVGGVFNAVVTESSNAGVSVFEGRGAGERPTASAIVSDLADLARGFAVPAFGIPAARLAPAKRAPLDARTGSFYLRFNVLDKPGVVAVISGCLAEQGISIESMLQRGRAPGEPVAIVMITHDASEAAMAAAFELIAGQGVLVEPACLIRMERF
ncbi:MAG TPA: homoserine dehydrogenase [Micropepsaceae bacterium]|nr:homoserine dehydrogenase [Micropepsaceae bacterium]